MPNLNTLDTLIAVVIVLLVLSLIVQSVQEAIKKLLKLKSRQIEESLVDLFENVIGKNKLKVTEICLVEMRNAGVSPEVLEKIKAIGLNAIEEQQFRAKLINDIGQPALERRLSDGQQVGELIMLHVERTKNDQCLERSRMPLRQLVAPHPSKLASPQAEELFNDVMKGFREIGRVSASSKRMLNSISKEDLMKVLQRVGLSRMLPPSIMRLREACDIFTSLEQVMETAAAIIHTLDGETGVKFAKLQTMLAPLLNDLRSFFKEDKSFNPDLLMADVLNLRGVKLGEVLDLLGAVQQNVDAELTPLPPAAPLDDARKKELENAKKILSKIGQYLTEMNQKLDAALAPLRLKLAEVENWYDTVMQSFEERYNRGMKTVAFIISLIVAVWLNANIFAIYSSLAKSQTQRDVVLQYAPEALKRYNEAHTKAIAENNQASQKKIEDQIKDTKNELTEATNAYATLGFPPLRVEGLALKKWYDDPELTFGKKAWNIGRHCFYLLFGWLLMAALLSVGAPFWNDTLKSLFGVKNLLQKKGEIKNVEQKAGEGQPKS